MRSFVLSAAAALLLADVAWADLAPPLPPAKEVAITVEVDENAKESKLLVPQQYTVPQRVRPPQRKIGALDTHTIIAGTALALSLTCGGLWLVRRGRSVRGVGLAVGAVALLGVGALAWANVAAPPPPPAKPDPAALLPVAFDGKIKFEVVQRGDTIRLVLDKATYAALKEKPKAAEGKSGAGAPPKSE